MPVIDSTKLKTIIFTHLYFKIHLVSLYYSCRMDKSPLIIISYVTISIIKIIYSLQACILIDTSKKNYEFCWNLNMHVNKNNTTTMFTLFDLQWNFGFKRIFISRRRRPKSSQEIMMLIIMLMNLHCYKQN